MESPVNCLIVSTPSTAASGKRSVDLSVLAKVSCAPLGNCGELKFATKRVDFIGCALGEGQDKEGVTDGPRALRRGGLVSVIEGAGFEVCDLGDVSGSSEAYDMNADSSLARIPSGESTFPQPEGIYSEKEIHNSDAIGSASFKLFRKVAGAATKKHFVLSLGGDHSTAFGSIAGMRSVYPDLKVIWIDAHADANTPETSPSGNYHGMPAAHLLGWFKKQAPGFEWTKDHIRSVLQERDLAYIGLRDLDEAEKANLRQSEISCFTMHHIDKYGIANVVDKILNTLDPNETSPIHISLDIDGCDPAVAPGTGTRANGGLSYREIHFILETVAATKRLVSLDVVEINPILDMPQLAGMHGDLPALQGKTIITQTVKLGLECINSALGGTIL